MGRMALGLFLILSVAIPALAQGPPPDPNREVRSVIDAVRERAEVQKREDQRRALLLIQKAHTAHQAGRLQEASDLSQRAQQLFPESAEIKEAVRSFRVEQRGQREHADGVALARDRLDEALKHAGALFRDGRYSEARDLAEAVQEAVQRFPPQIDVSEPKRAAEKFLIELYGRAKAGLIELKPRAPRPDPELTDAALRRGMNKSMSVNWRNETLASALEEIVRETGIPVKIDPALERLRIPATRRVIMQARDLAAWRLLRSLTEATATEYILTSEQIVITTKTKALAYTLVRSRGQPEKEALDRLLRGEPLRADPKEEPAVSKRWVDDEKVPDYLRSDGAFLMHIEELLKPRSARKTAP